MGGQPSTWLVGLEPLFKGKLGKKWRRELAVAYQAPLHLSSTIVDNEDLLRAMNSASFLSAKLHAGSPFKNQSG